MSSADVLFVSKPVAPPWNDSSKNLVRDLAGALRSFRGISLARRGTGGPGRAIYPPVVEGGGFAPGLRDQLAVLGALAVSREPIWHFFFAPNPRTSTVGRWASRLRGRKTVHTVCSAPAAGAALGQVLFADRTVVLSAATERRFLAEGVDPARLRRIAPAVPALPAPDDATRARIRSELQVPEGAPVAIYAGDLEFGGGAERSLAVLEEHSSAVLLMACRAKTAAAAAEETRLRRGLGRGERVRWLGETPRILDLVGASDLLLLPSDSLYAKMDYPLVVLEAMAMGVPALVCAETPAAELAPHGVVAAPAAAAATEAARLLEAPRRLAALGEAGRKVALSDHSPEAMARRYEAVYEELSDQ